MSDFIEENNLLLARVPSYLEYNFVRNSINGSEFACGIERLSRRLVSENSKFKLFFDHIVDRISGESVDNFLIVEPKNKKIDGITGVAILPIFSGNIGLVRIYRPPVEGWCYEIPHGFIESGESETAAAKRELMEEAGLKVDILEDLGLVMPDSGIIAAQVRLYVAHVSALACPQDLEMGLREFIWLPMSRFEQMLQDSSIQDSFTLSAWCRYLLASKSKTLKEKI